MARVSNTSTPDQHRGLAQQLLETTDTLHRLDTLLQLLNSSG